jgi:hypothetical protein
MIILYNLFYLFYYFSKSPFIVNYYKLLLPEIKIEKGKEDHPMLMLDYGNKGVYFILLF